MLTHVFKHYEVDLSRDTAIPSAVSIDRTLLKRMQVVLVSVPMFLMHLLLSFILDLSLHLFKP